MARIARIARIKGLFFSSGYLGAYSEICGIDVFCFLARIARITLIFIMSVVFRCLNSIDEISRRKFGYVRLKYVERLINTLRHAFRYPLKQLDQFHCPALFQR